MLNIFIVSFSILSIILFINSIGFTFNVPEHTKKLIQIITLEILVILFCDVNKCNSGNTKGSTFYSRENGKTNALSHYYFQNKCYGNGY